jgi:hypothetical protein
MSFLSYLRRHRKDDLKPFEVDGVVGVLAVLILSVFSLSLVDQYLLRSGTFAAVISSVLVDLANSDRQANALGGLAINEKLVSAAQAKANDMASKSYFAHVSPEGRDSWYWFKQAGYPFASAGENLAVDFSDSVDVERAWMNSPSHRANILNGRFTEIGIATAQGVYQGRSTVFVVQMFGRPASRSVAPASVRAESLPSEPTVPAFATTEPIPAQAPTTSTVAGAAASTTLNVEPVETIVLGATSPTSASWWQHVIASPKTMLRYAFFIFAGVILIILAFVTELEFHRRHLCHAGAATALLVLMAILFLVADFLLFPQPVIALVLPS